MPVYLGEYSGCATDRKDKFIRAINSFLSNDSKGITLLNLQKEQGYLIFIEDSSYLK